MVKRGFRGWEVEYQDGTVINEDQAEWKEIPKVGMRRLTLHHDGKQWDMLNKPAYFQKKRASVIPNIPGSFRVESRTIGFYEDQNKVLYTVDEVTGKMTMEVREIN
jgi:hypothetical protein